MDTTSRDGAGDPSSAVPEGVDAEAIFMLLLKISPEAAIFVDRAQRVGGLNPTAERLFGRTEEAARGGRLEDLLTSAGSEAGEARSGARPGSAAPGAVTCLGRRADGSTFPVEVHAEAIGHDPGDQVLFIRDLTELRETQRRHRELQIELVQAFRLLGSTRAALNLAQELNQPLSAISSYLSGGLRRLERRETDKALQAIGKAAEQVERAARMVRGVRELGRRAEASRRAYDLAQLIGRALARALAWKPRDWAEHQVSVEPASHTVLVDEAQILPVFTELIRAAFDATPDGAARRLRIDALPVSAEFTEISIVSDWDDRRAGADEPLPDEPSESEDSVRLSLCRVIIEEYGGRLLVARTPDEAAFRLTLPTAG